MMRRSRRTEILSDDAYYIFHKPVDFTGNFLIDDTFLAGEGATDFDLYLFFFQAEDGIRYFHVTGVQTCALPISRPPKYLVTLLKSSKGSPTSRLDCSMLIIHSCSAAHALLHPPYYSTCTSVSKSGAPGWTSSEPISTSSSLPCRNSRRRRALGIRPSGRKIITRMRTTPKIRLRMLPKVKPGKTWEMDMRTLCMKLLGSAASVSSWARINSLIA